MGKRIAFLDYTRVLACFMVMLVHASENYYGGLEGAGTAGPSSYLVSEVERLWVSIYDGTCRISVPLFMIVSAFLLVPMSENITSWQFYKKRFLRVAPPFLVFMVLYATLPYIWGDLSSEAVLFELSYIPLNFPSIAGHFWFFYPLISLYLFIPIISPWIRKATANEELFFIGLFVLSTTIPYLNRFCGEVWGQCFWNEYHALWYFAGYLGYLVLAHYIHHHLTWDTKKRMGWGSLMFLIGTVWTILSFYIQAVPGISHSTPEIELGWSFCTINVVIATTGAFLMLSCIKSEKGVMVELSKLSFGMYLMHIFWLSLWVWVIKGVLDMPVVWAIPSMAVLTFLTCWLTTKILTYLPWSYWIVGCGKK